MQRVLIVDDDRKVGACLKKLIPWEELDMELAGLAYDGDEGFQMAMERTPEIIISDLVMPSMDGMAFCERVMKIMTNVSFIFLSGYEDFAAAQLALKYRVRDYIMKPLDRAKVNYIIDLLRSISRSSDRKAYYNQILHDANMADQIVAAIRARSMEYFQGIFHAMARDADMFAREPYFPYNVCQRLINLLFDAAGEADEPRRSATLREIGGTRFAMDMIIETYEQYRARLQPSEAVEQAYYSRLTEQVRAYIREECTRPDLSLTVLVAKFNYSPDYLGRVFSKYTSDTVLGYITECRMARVQALLTDLSMPIADIARAVGYQSERHMVQLFKRRIGVTPAEFRRANARRCGQ